MYYIKVIEYHHLLICTCTQPRLQPLSILQQQDRLHTSIHERSRGWQWLSSAAGAAPLPPSHCCMRSRRVLQAPPLLKIRHAHPHGCTRPAEHAAMSSKRKRSEDDKKPLFKATSTPSPTTTRSTTISIKVHFVSIKQ